MGSGCLKVTKYFLFLFNLLFFILGAVILGFGIWILVDKNSFIYVLQTSSSSLNTGAYILIGVGAVTMLMGFLGCIGAVNEIRCLLGLYFTCLLLILIGQIAAGLIIYLQRNVLKAEVSGIVHKLIQDYDPNDEHNRTIENAWDYVQSQTLTYNRPAKLVNYQAETGMYCAKFQMPLISKWKQVVSLSFGVFCENGISHFFLCWIKDAEQTKAKLPASALKSEVSGICEKKHQHSLSCCGWTGPENWTQNIILLDKNQTSYPCSCKNGTKGSLLEEGFCSLDIASNPNATFADWPVNKQGCMEGVEAWVQENLGVILGVCAGVAVIELLGMVLSICLCKNVHSEDYTKVPKY